MDTARRSEVWFLKCPMTRLAFDLDMPALGFVLVAFFNPNLEIGL